MAAKSDFLTIGQLAKRCGLATSALRFYEAEGLIKAERDPGGRRRFIRSTLRRVAFVQAGQRVGLSLQEVRQTLAILPENRTPNRSDWALLSRSWRGRLDERIHDLERLRDELLCRGGTNKEVALLLEISPKTVGHHVSHIYDKIGVSTRAGATLFAVERDLLQ